MPGFLHAAAPWVIGPAGPRALCSPGAPPPPLLGSRASLTPPTLWQSLRRGSPRSISRGVQNLSRPSVTLGTKTISGPRALGPGPTGATRGDPERAPCGVPYTPPSQPRGPAGWGPEVTQRSQRDKRHPLALAPIPERPAR